MSDTKRLYVPFEIKADGPEGRLTAAIVKFDAVDSDRDVILRSAWQPGQVVPIVPAHDWKSYAIGEGNAAQTGEWGIVDGELFTDTTLGMDWYKSMKRRGDRQQWSFGFRITDAEPGTVGEKSVRIIKGLTIFEASPVLVGAQQQSHLLGIKGQSFTDEAAAAHAAVLSLIERARSLADLRAKEGRVLSEANRTRLASLAEAMRTVLSDVDDLLTSTERQADDDTGKAAADGLRLHIEHQRTIARHLGVAI